MMGPFIDSDYLKFRIYLERAVDVDPYEFADWIRANVHRLNSDIEDGLTQDEVGAWLRELFVSEKRLNRIPKALQS